MSMVVRLEHGRRCAVLGSPIGHSLSPVMHRVAYQHLRLDWTYDAIQVDETGLARFLAGLDEAWRGLSLTMPLKRAVLPLLDVMTDTARLARAVNTVILEHGLKRGDNTDVPGMVSALAERGVTRVTSAAVLGTGATAASAIAALAHLGVRHIVIRGRDTRRASDLAGWAESLGLVAAPAGMDSPLTGDVEVLVSTVPAAALSRLNPDLLVQHARVVLDVSYHPWPSPLLERARAHGLVAVTGLDLLVHQAALQVELMTGGLVPVDALREAGQAALGSRP